VPLSEDEQRILQEIERNFYESDPSFAREVSARTLYRHAGRNLKWAAVGVVVGFVVLVSSFTSSLALGFAGFLVMLASAFLFERNQRKVGRAGWQQLTRSARAGSLSGRLASPGQRLRDRFRRED
jgi:sulfite exporter TauE/SafE